MATSSAHFGFVKPDQYEYYDVSIVNSNTDNIDQEIYNVYAHVDAALPDVPALIAAHDASVVAHPYILGLLAELERAVDKVNLKYDTEVTGNIFTVTFDDLDEVTVDGVWASALARVEFGEVG